MVPKVDTFARDIAEEIKHKEASLADIATASNDLSNLGGDDVQPENKSSKIFGVAIVFLVMGIVGLVGFIYYYFMTMSTPDAPLPAPQTTATTQATSTKKTELSSISGTLVTTIGQHVEKVEKKDEGYILTLSSYSPVFAYMTRNEIDYIQELLMAVNGNVVSSKKPTPATPTTATTSISLATSTASSTLLAASSTSSSSSTPTGEAMTIEPQFSNVTLSNVNIRVYKEGGKTVAYSFASTQKLIIAKTPDEVLAIKNAILR